jgi:DNA primase
MINSLEVSEQTTSLLNQYRTDSELFTKYAAKLFDRADVSKIDWITERRGFQAQTWLDAGIFYVDDAVKFALPEFIEQSADILNRFGIIDAKTKQIMFRDRFIIPIRDTRGAVINFVGYTPNSDMRYLYGHGKYYTRTTAFGLENLNHIAELGVAIVTEGITDALRIRELGFKNVLAMCGTRRSLGTELLLNKLCKKGVIIIPDTDTAGIKAEADWLFKRKVVLVLPYDGVKQGRMRYKDADEYATLGGADDLRDCISAVQENLLNSNLFVGERQVVHI